MPQNHMSVSARLTQVLCCMKPAHPGMQAIGPEHEDHGVFQRLHVPPGAHAQLAEADDGVQHHLRTERVTESTRGSPNRDRLGNTIS